MKSNLSDEKYMRMAISLAKKGIGETNPNPAVGAVLVKNGRVIASAYHKKAGLPHAEALVINKAGKKARGATLYCTLEACAHYGKTPPCIDAIIKSGIKRAIFAMKDPNPINYGRGIAKLKKAGIETEYGLLGKESSMLNRPFIKFMKNRLPYVTLKMAQSVDGKIADAKGRSRWITSLSSRRLAHKLRAKNEAVMIGINTLLTDNPFLTNRTSNQIGRQPLRIVLDTNLRTPLRSRVLKNNKIKGGEVLIAGGMGAPFKKKTLLEKKGAKVILLPRKNGRIDLLYLMKYLASINVMSVLCEGGGELAASLLKDKLVDEIFFFISPRLIGGRTSPTSCGGSYSDIRKSIRLKNISVERIGPDILIRGYL
jgi:diaminohydroxyphosphoribosylaminopyrimidine deaminase/5-amino-6-(5-phosphoribosylamino)uracil reductase